MIHPQQHDHFCKNQYDSIAAQISRASENWGFFPIINHGIPDSISARVQAAGKAFFQLATQEKEAYANEAQNPIGYGSKGTDETILPVKRQTIWATPLNQRSMPEIVTIV